MKLRIEKAIYGGAGLAHSEGKAIFVPFALPGEEVEARVTEDKRSYAMAELESLVNPSPDRADAPCPSFGACGGCHYQNAQYAAQIAIKASILRETLERARIRDIPRIVPVTAEPLGYRNRIRLHVQRNPYHLCYKLRTSHVNLPVDVCPVAAPLLQNALMRLNQTGGALGLGDWAREVELFVNHDESALLLALWTEHRGAEQALVKLWPRLRESIPQLVGSGVFSIERGRRVPRLLARAGAFGLSYRCAARDYRVSLGSFFQVNRFLLDQLVQIVTDSERGGAAWDLYAGAGLFSLPLTASFEEVTAVESGLGSVRDLRENLRGTRHRIAAGMTDAFLRQAIARPGARPDLVVVDPPREGLGAAVTSALGKIRPSRITYVSCDPATLSRDLAALLESGYRLDRMHLVDLFPQTFHLETVTHLVLG